MKPHLFSTSISIALLLPLTLAIRSDAEQNRGDLPPITTTRLAQSDSLDDSPRPQQVQTAAQQITVRVTSAQNGGSGVLVAQKGSTYLVLTNRHVTGRDTQFQIQTPDGQKHAARLVPNTGINPKYDLALLQFTSSKQYQLAKFKYEDGSGITPLDPDRAIYSAGFPFDSERLRFSNGKVSQLSDVPLEDGTQIGYTIDRGEKELRQGMSGGPIIDAGGLVIGINTVGSNPLLPSYAYFDGSKPTATRAAQYQQANWGIPIYNFLTQLDANILFNYDNFPKVQRQVTPTGYMAKLNRETRLKTVRIETANAGNGSGVIVAKQGDTYYVLTAKHVLETPPTETKPKQLHTGIKVITHEQEIYEIERSNIRLAEGLDLAVVKFTSKVNYPVAKLRTYINSSDFVFAAGYPGRDKIDSPLWQWQLNPGWIYDKEEGKFEAQDKNSLSNGYDLIYNSMSYGGMSGGAIFDTDGSVIGIHGQAEQTNDVLLGRSLGMSIQTFIKISDRLQVPSSLIISADRARKLSDEDRNTIFDFRDNISEPQGENNGEQWLRYANQLYRNYHPSDALLAFDKAIAINKKYTLLGNYGKAVILQIMDARKGLTAISIAISEVPASDRKKYYYLWKYQSNIYRSLDKYDDAIKSINQAIELEPNDSILFVLKSKIFEQKKQYKEAIAVLDLLIKKQPEAYIYLNRGSLNEQLKQYQEAVVDYSRAIQIDPTYNIAYYNRGKAKYHLGQQEEAIADYSQAIKIDPKYTDAYYSRGISKAKLKQFSAAIIDYTRVIEIDPEHADAYYSRGNAKSKLWQKEEAIADYTQVIKINPKSDNAYYSRGNAKSDLGQNQEAIADYSQAIKINPEYADAYNNRGAAKANLGRKEAAIEDYNLAIEIDPKHAMAYDNRGRMKYYLGQKQAAIADYDRAITINPNYSRAYYNRGNAKYSLGQKQEAIADYDRVIMILPNHAMAYYDRGIAKYDLGQKEKAIIDLTKSAELFRQQNQMDYYKLAIEFINKIQEQKK